MVFGASALNLSEIQVSWLVYANIIGGLVGGILLGEASRRFGNKTNILLCNIAVFITLSMAVLLAFFPILGYIWLFVTCILASLAMNNWFGYLNYFLDIAPSEERSAFQVIGTSIGIPFSFSGYAMGAIIDNFGFVTMFTTGGVFAAAAIYLSIRLLSKRQIASAI
jgi:MFS family permease